jgi:hypothetical protein
VVHILAILLVVSFLFILLTPKIHRTLYPHSGNQSLQEFQEIIIKTGNIDPQTYWRFREFYSPGVYSINKNGLTKQSIQEFFKPLPPGLHIQPELFFLSFHSPRLKSLDGLTTKTSMSDLIQIQDLEKSHILKETDKELLYQLNSNTVVLVTLFSPEEMRKTNGFWDYQNDQSIIKDKNWISISIISH